MALHELYKYINKYYDQVGRTLGPDWGAESWMWEGVWPCDSCGEPSGLPPAQNMSGAGSWACEVLFKHASWCWLCSYWSPPCIRVPQRAHRCGRGGGWWLGVYQGLEMVYRMCWEGLAAALSVLTLPWLRFLPEATGGNVQCSHLCGCGPGWAAREEGPGSEPGVSKVIDGAIFLGDSWAGPQDQSTQHSAS